MKSLIFLSLFVVALVGCSSPSLSPSTMDDNPDSSDSSYIDKIRKYGLIPAGAQFNHVYLGTSDKNASIMNRPEMEVYFSYEFGIMQHEVTQHEYREMKLGIVDTSVWSTSDSLPITNVTYYDAVLFANAKSKAMGLDTVYTYSKVSFDANGNCIFLTGLVPHLDVFGFRLPTEAEWVFCASQGWDVFNGWTNDNSGSSLHPVCTLPANELQLCDMVGNAMEWVNDWMGDLHNTTVSDYVGASCEGPRSERVVKGGSFKNAASTIKPYSRGDTYTVTSSDKALYIGFRLALGSIKNPFWVDDNGKSPKSPVYPMASLADIFAWTGTYDNKLVYRNDVTGNLQYLDYTSGKLSVVEIEDNLDVYHPDISPDGKRVAFCTGREGGIESSSVYVRNLDEKGSGLVRLDVPNAAIPRWQITADGDTSIVYVTSTNINSEASEWIQQSTWRVSFANGNFGTPQKLFDGTFNGGVADDNRFAVSGANLLRTVKMGESGLAEHTIWYNGEQACNVSLASDGSNRVLFLDFASMTGMSFVGAPYGMHQRMFIADSNGNLIGAVSAPPGSSFDHTEWVGKTNFAVATLTNTENAHRSVVLIDVANSQILELVEGEELWHPCFWSKKKNSISRADVNFDMDSAGIYLYPGLGWIHEDLRVKMDVMWHNYENVEYLFVGSSRTENGLVPTAFKSGFAINMGYPGCELYSATYIAENYGFKLMRNLKAVVLSIDIGLWHTVSFSYGVFFDALPGYVYDRNHNFWVDGVPDSFVDAVENAYPAPRETYELLAPTYGFSKLSSASWGDLLLEADSNWVDFQRDSLDLNLARLESFIKSANERGLEVVGIIFPQNPGYRETGSFGRYGPARSRIPEIMDSLSAIVNRNLNFHLMDENKMGNHDYTKKMAFNADHLAYEGALRVTSRLDSLFKSLNETKENR